MIYIDFAFLGQESIDAALAAHCAGDQNKFWEYHDLLFGSRTGENVGDFKRENLDKFATQLNLNMDQFKQCVDSKKYADFLTAERQEGQRNGVSSTPTIFVNGQPNAGFIPYDSQKADADLTLAAGAKITGEDLAKPGTQVCVTGKTDDQRRVTEGAFVAPPGTADALCGTLNNYTAATTDKAGRLTMTYEQPGMKQMIEDELKKAK